MIFYAGPDAAWTNPPSDAMEYAISAHRLVNHGTYDVMMNGTAHPPRYSPGFPVLFLAPVYWLNGNHFGYGIFPVFACALLTLGIIWHVCLRLLQKGWRGIAAATATLACLVMTPFFVARAREIMSDIPLIAFSLMGLLIYHRAWKQSRCTDFLLAGILTALLMWIRITYLSLVIPFAFLLLRDSQRFESRKLIALIGPVAVGIGGLLYHNATTFGDPFYTGYQYWLAPPYYALSTRHILPNLVALTNPFLMFPSASLTVKEFIGPCFLIGVGVVCLLCRKRNPELWAEASFILHFVLMTALPIFVFHLFYPWYIVRFVLLFHTLLYLLGSICLVGLLTRTPEKAFAIFSIALILVMVMAGLPKKNVVRFSQYEVVSAADQILPKDAFFISNLNGIYVDAMVIGDTARKHILFDRYTSFSSVWDSIGYPDAAPIKPFAYTALEEPEFISSLLMERRKVFIHVPATIMSITAWKRFSREFKLEERWRARPEGPWIAEVIPLSDNEAL